MQFVMKHDFTKAVIILNYDYNYSTAILFPTQLVGVRQFRDYTPVVVCYVLSMQCVYKYALHAIFSKSIHSIRTPRAR